MIAVRRSLYETIVNDDVEKSKWEAMVFCWRQCSEILKDLKKIKNPVDVASASSEFRHVIDQITQTAEVLLFDSLVNTN